MKKLVLVLVSSVIIMVFVAFNYLLWVSEQNVKNNEDKDTLIAALGRDIKNLEDNNRQVIGQRNKIDEERTNLQTKYLELKNKEEQVRTQLEQKNEIIYKYKTQIDLKPAGNVVRAWADHIINGEYDKSYALMANPLNNDGKPMSAEEYTQYYSEYVGSLKLTSLELYTKDMPVDKKGDIIFTAVLDITMIKNEGNPRYEDGQNQRYFNMVFDAERNTWLIASITKTP